MNQKNVQKLLEAFEARSDIMPVVEKSKCETILMAGAKAEAHVKGIDAIFSVSDKTKTSMMKIDGVFTILDEAPGKLANAILLFTKGMYLSISFVFSGCFNHKVQIRTFQLSTIRHDIL